MEQITLEELNYAYNKVNEIKNSFTSHKEAPREIEVTLDRNPLIDEHCFADSSFVTPFKLKFKHHLSINDKRYYILATKVIIVDED